MKRTNHIAVENRLLQRPDRVIKKEKSKIKFNPKFFFTIIFFSREEAGLVKMVFC